MVASDLAERNGLDRLGPGRRKDRTRSLEELNGLLMALPYMMGLLLCIRRGRCGVCFCCLFVLICSYSSTVMVVPSRYVQSSETHLDPNQKLVLLWRLSSTT